MNDAPETSLIHVGNNHWMSEAEARARGLRPASEASPAKPALTISWGDRIFGLVLLLIIIAISTIFTNGLHTVMWGY